jgi:hypothetical protein
MKHAHKRLADVEITSGFVLHVRSVGTSAAIKADLGMVGAQLLHDALGEYLGRRVKSAGRASSTSIAGRDLTEYPEVKPAPVVHL